MAAGAEKVEGSDNVNGSSSDHTTPCFEKQKDEIEELLKTPLTKGETWYLVDCKWLKQWKKYVGFDTWDHYGSGDDMYHPGPIDNSILFKDGKLKEHLIDELDYCVLPEPGWEKLSLWYGMVPGQDPVPRKVVEHGMYVRHCKVEVYLTEVRLCQNSALDKFVAKQFSKGDTLAEIVSVMKEMFDIPAETETRLWNKYMSNTFELLSNMENTVQEAGLYQGQVLVIETKNEDGTWQRETSSSSYSSSKVSSNFSMYGSSSSYGSSSYNSSGDYWSQSDKNRKEYHTPGLTGLRNLGNTCFMNSGLQCLSNSMPLTKYFLSGGYKHELNLTNPLGMRGEIAKHFAALLNELWSGEFGSVSPRPFKMQVGRFAPQFSGYQQQDSQEFLAFLLDGIHEDLNRVKKKPYIDVKDANGRPDEIVAGEAWDNHRQRNDSIIVDTFHGLFKSTLVCPDCSKVSVTFDPFCYLSLPLPTKKERKINVFLIRSDPMKKPMLYKVTVPKMGCVGDMISALSKLTGITSEKMVVTDVYNHRFHKVFGANEALTQILDRDDIFVYELTHDVEDEEAIALPVYQRERKSRFGYGSSNKILFGLPLYVAVPRQNLTYSDLYSVILDTMRRYVVVPGNDAEMDCDGDKNNKDNSCDEEMNETKCQGNENEETNGEEVQKGCKKVQPNSAENDDDDDVDEDGNAETRETEDNPSTTTADRRKSKKNTTVKADKYIFSMTFVNSYGSADIQVLHDTGKPLQLSGRCYLALDWNSKAKESFYNDQIAEESEEHETVQRKMPPKKNMVSLSDCINEFLKMETLGANDLWYCPQCEKHQQATKKFDLWSLPKMLVVHLKRFSYNSYWRDKLDTLVDFPLRNLDMSQYVINNNQQTLYNLVAVSNHYGGMGGGHYTAYAKNCENDHWYSFDDSSVSAIDESQPVSKAAYVLFYQRVDSDADRGPEDERMSETNEEHKSEEDMDVK